MRQICGNVYLLLAALTGDLTQVIAKGVLQQRRKVTSVKNELHAHSELRTGLRGRENYAKLPMLG